MLRCLLATHLFVEFVQRVAQIDLKLRNISRYAGVLVAHDPVLARLLAGIVVLAHDVRHTLQAFFEGGW